ncbi:hypothetical protein [Streptoalloteichus hindustanus]|uniref:Uncharacterized protein n=1 Tax=Streptoalloteichus hindustanus TaxID=2017 RepID=A0A1M5D174_STRHI|nr:hypothetical protein [Streptoalloteichus hindustanus]SHF60741.1 hypothetical protein SAMN05444320_104256 [Streptoalloteichus hindustanus]
MEIGFERDAGVWLCRSVALQVHRLTTGNTPTPPPLQATYSAFGRRLRFEPLRHALATHGRALQLAERHSDTDVHRLPEGGVSVHVFSQDIWEHQAGDVCKVGFWRQGTEA